MSATPAWSGAFDRGALEEVVGLPIEDVRDWAFGGATGAGVKVAVVDSGVDADHPRVRGIAGGVAFELDPSAELGYVERRWAARRPGRPRDGVRGRDRSWRPRPRSTRVRVLGAQPQGSGCAAARGRTWAVERGMHVANLSLSSKSDAHVRARSTRSRDDAYFAGTVLICAANNLPGPTYPSQSRRSYPSPLARVARR